MGAAAFYTAVHEQRIGNAQEVGAALTSAELLRRLARGAPLQRRECELPSCRAAASAELLRRLLKYLLNRGPAVEQKSGTSIALHSVIIRTFKRCVLNKVVDFGCNF